MTKINLLLSDDTVVEIDPIEWKNVDLILRDRKIAEMLLVLDKNKFYLPKKADGYVFIKKIIKSMNGQSDMYLLGIGHLVKDQVEMSWISEKSASIVGTETRPISRSKIGLVYNKKL